MAEAIKGIDLGPVKGSKGDKGDPGERARRANRSSGERWGGRCQYSHYFYPSSAETEYCKWGKIWDNPGKSCEVFCRFKDACV